MIDSHGVGIIEELVGCFSGGTSPAVTTSLDLTLSNAPSSWKRNHSPALSANDG